MFFQGTTGTKGDVGMDFPDTERLLISMLCESLAVNTDYIIEQSRAGHLPLWVELVNVAVVHLATKKDDPANVKRIAKYDYTSIEHAENGIEVILDRSMITQFVGNSRVDIRDVRGVDRDGRPVLVWTIPRFVRMHSSASKRASWDNLEKHFTHDGNHDTEVVRLCIEKIKREHQREAPHDPNHDSKINSKISISTASLYALPGDVEAFKKENRRSRETIVSPTVPTGNILSDKQNYFIFKGDFWAVRFNGGKECHIKGSKPIRTLVDYLQSAGVKLNKRELYARLNSPGQDKTQEKYEEGFQTHEACIEMFDAKARAGIDEKFKDILERAYQCRCQGRREEAEELGSQAEKISEYVKAGGGYCDFETKEINWEGRSTIKQDSSKIVENVTLNIKRAIDRIAKNNGDKMDELASHLRRYLIIKESIYKPPKDFQSWHIST